ncbi:MFS transporter [Corynebacterium breve]|uniref:MFS transporter n=1 Tax=Corynebacterium breve TaxID=3049799 RepID=A0ABY8VBZ8_9CORY|nr:MFS transporter [Corynebacterium breve]WIM67194.1 MFS transporter [Corynebacterium breve]
MDIRSRIDSSPMTGYQWLIVALVTFLNALDGFDLVAMAYSANAISDQFGIGPSALGWLLSSALIGVGIGALFLGPAADRFGRRRLILIAVIIDIVGLTMTGLATAFPTLLFWRVVTGIGVGGILACITVVTSEYSNRKYRGLAMAIYASGYGIGASICGALAARFIPTIGWEWIFFTGAILSAIGLLLTLVILPESVDYLSNRRDLDSVRRVSRRIGHGADVELNPVIVADKTPIRELVSDRFWPVTLRLWIAFCFVNFGFAFANSWTPKLLSESGLSAQQGIIGGIMISFGGTIGSLIFGALTTKIPARNLLITFSILGAGALVGFIYSTSLPGVMFTLGVLVGMLLNGCVTGMYTITPAAYPSRLRATGVGTALAVGRIGAVLGPLIIGYLAEAGWTPQALYVSAAAVFVLTAFALAGLRTPDTEIKEASLADDPAVVVRQ